MEYRISYAVVAGLLLVTTAQPSDFIHPKLKGHEMMVKSVVMLPPIVEMSKKGVKGTEGMGKEAEEATTEFATSVSTALTGRGLAVATPFSDEALKDNNELKYAIADVQKRFDEIAPQLFKKRKDVRKGRFSVGDSVALLNADGKADVLVISRVTGTKETKGKKMLTGCLLCGAMKNKAIFQSRVALVDAKSGDILFLGDYLSAGLPKDKTYEKSFKSIPVGAK